MGFVDDVAESVKMTEARYQAKAAWFKAETPEELKAAEELIKHACAPYGEIWLQIMSKFRGKTLEEILGVCKPDKQNT